jgi:TolA-binding protein
MRRSHIVQMATTILVASAAFAGVAQGQGDPGRGRDRDDRHQSDDQRKRIADEQRRTDEYRKHLDQQVQVAQQRAAQLQQAHRMAQYHAQQEYAAQLVKQREQLEAERRYETEPYVVAAPTFRYQFGGASHETNQYGADLLRQAVNNGYRRGYSAGAADRADHWRSDYTNSPEFQEASFGYTGSYVDLSDYSYYFREGFRRGYQDGYSAHFRYGSGSNGAYSILGGVLAGILNLRPIR